MGIDYVAALNWVNTSATVSVIAASLTVAGQTVTAENVGADAYATTNQKYVRAGASGTGSGDDWTNAYTSIPGTKVRDTTYWIADGSYSSPGTLSTAASSTSLIRIKKATASFHGTETGWDAAYGDGVATFSGGIEFTTDYWHFDGTTGGGPDSWTSGHGFKITESAASPLIKIGASSDYVTVRHIELQGTSNSGGGGSLAQDAVAVYGGSNFTLSHFYTHAIGRCPFFMVPAPDAVVEYGYIADYVSTESQHSEVWSTQSWSSGNATFRYNVIVHIEGTGGIMWDNSGAHSSEMRIYGNVFYNTGSGWSNNANGLIGGWTGGSGEDCYTLRIYNNSFINCTGTIFTDFITRSGDNIAKNNLFYNCDSPNYADIGTHDYNHYINSGGTHSETNGTSATSGDPFVSYSTLNFRLSGATTAGETLASPYDVDMYGTTRTTPDRGAAEYA